MKIIIDADACPKQVLEISKSLGKQHNIEVYTVANFNHDIKNKYHIVVDNNAQEADLKIMNMTNKDDIVITQDWGLAAMVISKKAVCLNPFGVQYDASNMDFLLEEREMKAKLRRSGGRTKGPKKRVPKNDLRFRDILENILQAKKAIPQ